MTARSSSNALKNFAKTCEEVIQNCDPIIITRENDKNVVLISLDEYNELLKKLPTEQSLNSAMW